MRASSRHSLFSRPSEMDRTPAPPSAQPQHAPTNDTVFAVACLCSCACPQAQSYAVSAGVSSSPWLVNVIKSTLPMLTGDGRASSSADGNYETTRFASSADADALRRLATLDAARTNAVSLPSAERATEHPGRYALFVTQVRVGCTSLHPCAPGHLGNLERPASIERLFSAGNECRLSRSPTRRLLG